MLRTTLTLSLVCILTIGGCPLVPTSGTGSAVGTTQVRLEVQFIAVEERLIEDIGIDFNQPIAIAGGPGNIPQLTTPVDPNGPRGFNGTTTGGIATADYIFPGNTTGGFLPASVGQQQNPAVLVYPGVLNDFDQVLDEGQTTNFVGPNDPIDLFVGQRNSDLASLFGSLLDTGSALNIVNDLATQPGTTIVDAPRVTVQNGQRSLVQVANEEALTSLSEFAYLNAIRANADPLPFSTWIGPVLDVTPVVVGDQIELQLVWGTQVISTPQDDLTRIGGNPTQIFLPIFQTGRAQTSVRVPNGGALLLGGFGRDGVVERGLPLLDDLPVIARTFQSEAVISDEQTLLILIRPRIVP